MAKPRLLVVHQNYPGQFRHLAPALSQQGWDVRALRQAPAAGQQPLPAALEGVALHGWTAQRGTTLSAHPWVHDTETKLIRAEAAARACDHHHVVAVGSQGNGYLHEPGVGGQLAWRDQTDAGHSRERYTRR
jgi:hypothetical protein